MTQTIPSVGIHNRLALLKDGANKINPDKIPEGMIEMRRAVRQL